jgi:putative flavoprotein involved in K+ transport
MPLRHGRAAARYGLPVVRFIGTHVLTLRNPVGRRVRPKFVARGTPLIRTKRKDLDEAGVRSVGRVIGVKDGLPMVEGDQTLDVSNVVWCTGFREDFPWVDLPAFDKDRRLIHDRGVVKSVPGLYVVGQEFQFAATSAVLPGVGRDAEYVARQIASAASGSQRTAAVGYRRSA